MSTKIDDIIEELEERAAIAHFEGGLDRYAAGQLACQYITAKYGDKHRARLICWLTREKHAERTVR